MDIAQAERIMTFIISHGYKRVGSQAKAHLTMLNLDLTILPMTPIYYLASNMGAWGDSQIPPFTKSRLDKEVMIKSHEHRPSYLLYKNYDYALVYSQGGMIKPYYTASYLTVIPFPWVKNQ